MTGTGAGEEDPGTTTGAGAEEENPGTTTGAGAKEEDPGATIAGIVETELEAPDSSNRITGHALLSTETRSGVTIVLLLKWN